MDHEPPAARLLDAHLSAQMQMQAYVRVTGSRLDAYVEFEFSLCDRDLTVELILPFRAFEDFCERQKAVILPPEPAVADALQRQAWRQHQPGLLRRVAARGADAGDY